MDISLISQRNFINLTPEYATFAAEKSQCRKCSIYLDYKGNVAQSEGNVKNPTFMFIGESLGETEEKEVQPFIGKAGQRLRNELRKHKDVFNKQTTIITNLLSCRPKDNKFPDKHNKDWFRLLPEDECTPTPLGKAIMSLREVSSKSIGKDIPSGLVAGKTMKGGEIVQLCATTWLEREILLLRPKVIVCLGAQSMEFITGESGITRNRGSWRFHEKYRAWVFPTYHPSYVLRCSNSEEKSHVVAEFEADIKKIVATWTAIIGNDPRMSMSIDDYNTSLAHQLFAESGVYKEQSIHD